MSKGWFITGASRGLGRIWATAAAERGDNVVATARDVATLADLLVQYPDRLHALPLDVTDREAAFAAVASAKEILGSLDVVVNNAGFGLFGVIEEVTEEQARQQIETNVFGALWVTQAALPIMREQRSGHLLQVSSIGGVHAFPGLGLYHASKWALEGLSQALAAEVAAFGIHVTLIEPRVTPPTGRSVPRCAPRRTLHTPNCVSRSWPHEPRLSLTGATPRRPRPSSCSSWTWTTRRFGCSSARDRTR